LNVKHLVLALMIAVSASAATAQDDLTIGKKVGDRMAPSLSAADQDGKPQHLQSLAGPNGLILLFSRSLDW
jgi:hypothetical protein